MSIALSSVSFHVPPLTLAPQQDQDWATTGEESPSRPKPPAEAAAVVAAAAAAAATSDDEDDTKTGWRSKQIDSPSEEGARPDDLCPE